MATVYQWLRPNGLLGKLEPAQNLWERACSRWRCVRRGRCWMCWPHREQARSHRFSGLYAKSANYSNYCGSWLASEGGVSGEVDVGCAGLFAGKPAPTV